MFLPKAKMYRRDSLEEYMRIGIDARFYGGEQSKGLGRYTQKLIEYLAANDTENDYVVFLQEKEFDEWSIDNPKFKPVKAPYRWYTIAEQFLMPWKIYKEKLDFIHFPHFNAPLFYRGRFVVTIHDLVISRFPTQRATTLAPWLYKIKQLAYKIVIRNAAKSSKKIITVSQYSKKDIIDYFKVPEDKVVVTYESADKHAEKEYTPAEEDEILKEYRIKKPYLLYVGNAYPHKNLEVLVKVVKELKKEDKMDWQLVLVGKEDYFYKRVKQLVWSQDVEDKIIFPGFVSDEHLPVLFKKSEVYIFPSKYEGFGLPPLEAMLYGAPVLAAKASCLPEILGDGALYFDPDDVYGIIKQINKLLDSPETRSDLIVKGKEQLSKYSWQKMAKETLEIYKSLQ